MFDRRLNSFTMNTLLTRYYFSSRLGNSNSITTFYLSHVENFPQAVEDYKTSLQTFTSILPFESREIASAHFKLGVVLESVAEGRQEALENIEKAIESVEARRESVIDGSVVGGAEGKGKGKGKGKAEGNLKLDEEERKRQEKECDELLIDLKAKVSIKGLSTRRQHDGTA